jgi:hypothetical protein
MTKADLFDARGFFFDYWHAAYVNRQRKMIISHLFVAAHSAEELDAHIAQAAPSNEWTFLCTVPPSQALQELVLARYT